MARRKAFERDRVLKGTSSWYGPARWHKTEHRGFFRMLRDWMGR